MKGIALKHGLFLSCLNNCKQTRFASIQSHLAVNAVFFTLNHMRQITFIHQALLAFYTIGNFSIYIKVFRLLFSIWYLHCVLEHNTFLIYACALPGFSSILKSFCPLRSTRQHEIQQDITIKTRPLHSCIATWRYRTQCANDASLRTDNCRTDSETENKLIVGWKVLLKLNLDYCVCSLFQEPSAQLTYISRLFCLLDHRFKLYFHGI